MKYFPLLLGLILGKSLGDTLSSIMLPPIKHAHVIPYYASVGSIFDSANTRLYVEFEEELELDLLGLEGTQPEFLCSDYFTLLDETSRSSRSLYGFCRACFSSTKGNSTTYAIFVFPPLFQQPDIRYYEIEKQDSIRLISQVPRTNALSIQVTGYPNQLVDLFILPDFALEAVGFVEESRFILRFSEAVHFVRQGRENNSKEPFTTGCSSVFVNFDPISKCYFEFDNLRVYVTVTRGSIPNKIVFDLDAAPAFFSTQDIFGLISVDSQSYFIKQRPKLLINTHLADGSVQFEFSEPLAVVAVDRVRCSEAIRFTNGDIEFFSERVDLFCGVFSLESNSNIVVLTFPEIVPYFPSNSSFYFEFYETEYFVDSNGLSPPINEGNIDFTPLDDIYAEFSLSVSGPRYLSKCDDIFFIEVFQDSGLNFLYKVRFDESSGVSDPSIELSDFCEIISNSVRCLPNELPAELVGNITFTFVFVAEAVFIEGYTELLNDLDVTNDFVVFQNFDKQVIPVQIAGVDLDSGVKASRGQPLSFTAVLGDVFSCVNTTETTAISFSWSIVSVSSEIVVDSSLTKIFVVNTDALLGSAFFDVSLTASIANEDELFPILASNKIVFSLEIEPVELVLVSILGLETTVSSNSDLVLSAGRSCNPNILSGSLCQTGIGYLGEITESLQPSDIGLQDYDISWSCNDCERRVYESCTFDYNQMDKLLITIPSCVLSKQGVSATFTFQVENTNSGYSGSIDVLVNIINTTTECELPVVEILPVDSRINAGSSVSISALVVPNDEEEYIFKWEESVTGGVLVFEKDDVQLERSVLFIPENTLSPGAFYIYSLSVTTPSCQTGNFSVSVSTSFNTNRAPFGGIVEVIPFSGTFLDSFQITTSGWIDADGDYPLEYAFEIAYVNEDAIFNEFDEILANVTIPLTQFSQSLSVSTNLQVNPKGTVGVLIALVRDSRGAVSKRLLSNAIVNVNADTQIEKEVENLIDDLVNTGDSAQIPNLCSAFASSINLSSTQNNEIIKIRDRCFGEVIGLLGDSFDVVALDTDVVNVVASSVLSLTRIYDENSRIELLKNTSYYLVNILESMRKVVSNTLRGSNDPNAGTLIPLSFRQNIVQIVSNLLALAIEGRNEQNTTVVGATCSALESVRSTVEQLGILQASLVVAGAPAILAESEFVKFAAVRERAGLVGTLTNRVRVPDSSAAGSNLVEFGEQFSDNFQNIADVLILGVKYGSFLECSRTRQDMNCLSTDELLGPLPGKEGKILAVDFFPLQNLEVFDALIFDNFSSFITLTLDKPENTSSSDYWWTNSVSDNCRDWTSSKYRGRDIVWKDAEFSCGLFDVDVGNFDTDICSVGVAEADNKLVCTCTHATDYTAWQAFKYDVKYTLQAQLLFSLKARLILFAFVPIFVVLATLLLYWSRISDKRDSSRILKGALARIKLTRTLKTLQKRRFFENVKTAQLETLMKIHDTRYILQSLNEEEDQTGKLTTHEERSFSISNRIYLTLKYEHSIFGLIKYDPNLSRFHRAFLFISIVVCTFGAAALLFELENDSYDLDTSFALLVSIASSFMVAVPLKLISRTLFKATENEACSKADQVNNALKVLTRLEHVDGTETAADAQLVEAILDLFMAEEKLKQSILRRSSSRSVGPGIPEESVVSTYNVTFVPPDITPEEEEEIEEVLLEHRVANYIKAKQSLSSATSFARSEWKNIRMDTSVSSQSRFYTSWSKLRSIRNQSNALLKFVSLFSDDASETPKPRSNPLPYWILVVDWFLVILVILFFSAYMVLFVLTRAQRVDEGFDKFLNDSGFEPMSEAEYFEEWLLGSLYGILFSYVIVEPSMALIRFVFFPWILSIFGTEKVPLSEAQIIEMVKHEEKHSRIRAAFVGCLTFVADLVPAVF